MSPAGDHPPDLAAIPTEDADTILGRLASALAREPTAVLATDADGTIWDGDVGFDLFEALFAEEGIRDAALAALQVEARDFGVPAEGNAMTVARALFAAHLTEQYPHDRAFAMMAWAFAGWTYPEVLAFAERVLDQGKIEGRIRPAMKTILRWAHEEGVPIYVVSASPIAIIEDGAARLGVPIAGKLAMTPALTSEGVLLPYLSAPAVYGEGKVHALERAGVADRLLAAFGDSTYDAAMLRKARVPVAVTPAPRLAALLPGIAGVTILRTPR